jgi:hypothetical protein
MTKKGEVKEENQCSVEIIIFFFTKDKNDGKHNYGIQFLTEEILSNINQEHEPLCFVQTLKTD